MQSILLYTAIAGVLGTTAGGIISIFMGGKNIQSTTTVLGIASGFMLGIAVFELVPSASMVSTWQIVCIGITVGVVAIALVEYILHRLSRSALISNSAAVGSSALKSGNSTLSNGNSTLSNGNSAAVGSSYASMGKVLLIAIALHNFPEGMAIGGVAPTGNALAMTLLMMLHNIPEGMAIATPMVAAGCGKLKIIIMLVMSGLPTILGGVLGGAMGVINPLLGGLSMAIAAGAMLYVIIFELNHEVYRVEKTWHNGAVATLIGLMISLILILAI